MLDVFRNRNPQRLLTPVVLLLALLSAERASAQQVSREYQLKAVFLYQFTQFVEWPTNAFDSTNAPMVIGVLGSFDPFGAVLDETVRGETVKGRRILVERYRRIEDVRNCHILFITQSESRRLERIVETLRGRPMLTVSDIELAAYRGVMVRFYTESNRIRLRINLESARTAGLTISSKLLRAAELVENFPAQ